MPIARRWLTHAVAAGCTSALLAVPATGHAGGILGFAVGGPSLVLQAMPGVVQVSAAAPAPATAPRLAWPMQGVITQGFGPSPYWFEPSVTVGGRVYPHFHTGIDIAAPWGTPVHAAGAGRVEYTGWQSGYGLCVVILQAGGLRTLYAHLERVSVRTGAEVATGTQVGLEGATGNATGPHLHFEVRPGPSTVTDPMNLLAPSSGDGVLESVPIRWSVPG